MKVVIRLIFLITAFVFASGKKCFAPVVCTEGQKASPEWIQVFPTLPSESERTCSKIRLTEEQEERKIYEKPKISYKNITKSFRKELLNMSQSNAILLEKFGNLTAMVELLNENNTKLSEKIDRLNENNTELSEKIDRLNENNTELSEKIDRLNENNTELSEKIDRLNENNRNLSEKIDSLKENNTKLSEKIDRLNESNTKLSEKIDRLDESNTKLSEKIDRLDESNTKLSGKIDLLNENNTKLTKMLDSLNKNNTKLYERNAELIKELELQATTNAKQTEKIALLDGIGSKIDYQRKIRLVNGKSFKNGRVEVLYNGTWGTVCDNKWRDTTGKHNADVVCKQLGFRRSIWYKEDNDRVRRYERGTGKIWLDFVICTGSENFISDCRHRPLGTNYCHHNEDVAVECE